MKPEILEVLGVACLAAFASFIWPPACLLVIGLACVAAAWVANSGGDS